MVYIKQDGKKVVIDFGPWHNKKRMSPDESGVISDAIAALEKNIVFAAQTIIAKSVKLGVRVMPVKSFLNRYKRVYVYRYGDAEAANLEDHHDGKIQGAAVRDRNQKSAADIAMFFAKNEGTFGQYLLASWNCEHFATFCHTTTLTAEELERKYREDKYSISNAFLRENSEALSVQAQRYISRKVLRVVEGDGVQLLEDVYEINDDSTDGADKMEFDQPDDEDVVASFASTNCARETNCRAVEHLGERRQGEARQRPSTIPSQAQLQQRRLSCDPA